MIEKIYLGFILLFFIISFAIKNMKTYLSTKKSIKGKSTKLTISIIMSTLIYGLVLLRLIILDPKWIIELNLSKYFWIKYLGLFFVTIGFITGILALIAIKDSWRVGIKYDQKTNLITTGVYRISRNPYFTSYGILIFGLILIFPSIILMILFFILVVTFHKMILEEEKYLESVHGEVYLNYKKKVNRYITVN